LVEGSRRKRGEKKHHGQNISPSGTVVPGGLNMTPGGNNFNYFPENQLTKFKLCPPNSLFCLPEDFCDAFCVAVGAFGRPMGRGAERES